MNNTIDYFEIGTPNGAASKAFYSKLFNWEIADSSFGGYQHIKDINGGIWDTSEMGGDHWAIFYIQVEDVKKAVEIAKQLGATVAIPYTDHESIEFAHLIDPQGSRFGVWRKK